MGFRGGIGERGIDAVVLKRDMLELDGRRSVVSERGRPDREGWEIVVHLDRNFFFEGRSGALGHGRDVLARWAEFPLAVCNRNGCGIDPEIVESATSNFNQSEFNTQPAARFYTLRLNLNF